MATGHASRHASRDASGHTTRAQIWSCLRTELRSWGTSGQPCRRRTVKNCERILSTLSRRALDNAGGHRGIYVVKLVTRYVVREHVGPSQRIGGAADTERQAQREGEDSCGSFHRCGSFFREGATQVL